MRNPPILISVLGFFGALAGFYWLYLGLRLLGFDWFGILGDVPSSSRRDCGAGLRSLAVSRDRGRRCAVVSPAVGLAVRDDHGRACAVRGVPVVPRPPGIGVGFGAAVMPLVIIWYLNTREVKAAFGLDTTAR